MRVIGQPATARNDQSKAEKIRHDARRFVDALALRLVELKGKAKEAESFDVFDSEKYAQFKQFFIRFGELCEEFLLLSSLTEESLANYARVAERHQNEHRSLEECFRKLQIPMLQTVIHTNLRLLRVWNDRLARGEGLPYGVREVFLETVRIFHNMRGELLRPRYIVLLDESALQEAEEADRLLRALIIRAPSLFDFALDTMPADQAHAGEVSIDAILQAVFAIRGVPAPRPKQSANR